MPVAVKLPGSSIALARNPKTVAYSNGSANNGVSEITVLCVWAVGENNCNANLDVLVGEANLEKTQTTSTE